MEIKGKLILKLETVTGESAKGQWSKKQFIIETAGQYPKQVCIMLWNDSIDYLEKYQIGDEITVSIEIESREYNDRWYTDVKAWKLEGQASAPAPADTITPEQDDLLF